ncbi:protein of unknown function DUF1025 [Coriobacterium glomerans PW2]|uniref:Zn-dependent protease n=1 Tax=Coriobacterium glomerans (strain ATCC 49209 / DSM 20642 / JCM 10262 / PW2) TaxID=700015 RepID=F2NA85_CORGP|nr:metallopeptidase family protein [Coriobacterium glomerans]AEB06271.1 protein of unknown function DUF1025 [Coriobacterium glomerans PW2]
MYEVDGRVFELLVDAAIATLPERFRDDIENLAFLVEDEPSAEQRSASAEGTVGSGYDVLGIYSGVPLNRRTTSYQMHPSDTITIFQGAHMRATDSYGALAERVRQTVVHEVGHYFGMDERRLSEMGYGSASYHPRSTQ